MKTRQSTDCHLAWNMSRRKLINKVFTTGTAHLSITLSKDTSSAELVMEGSDNVPQSMDREDTDSVAMVMEASGSASYEVTEDSDTNSINVTGDSDINPINVIEADDNTPAEVLEKQAGEMTGNRPKVYMTKRRKMEAKSKRQDDKKQAYKQAGEEFLQGKFKSIFEASKHYHLCYSSLYRYQVNGDSFAGRGRKSQVLSVDEEKKIVDHVKYRQKIGCGMTYLQLQLVIQEVLIFIDF